jgi:branched-subunit amino acid aminotransferase/4-amino-4-deoxychorismate lyase
MKAPLAYLNGRFVPCHEAALPLHDAGFVSGATVVDNARTFRHKVFRWPDHLARFRHDCAACFVPLEATDEQITATAEELVARNAMLLPPGGELQLVTFATPGPLGFYVGEGENGPPTLGMVTYPLPFARYRRFFTEGVTLVTAGGHWPLDTNCIVPPRVKHRSRLAWWVADQQLTDPWAGVPPGAVPILTYDREMKHLTETAIGNLLLVRGGTVVASSEHFVLDGISTRVVRELCGRLGVPFTTDLLLRKHAEASSEAMLTGTGFCLAGVRRLDEHEFDWPGPVSRKLLAAWAALVGVDIERQFVEQAP